jgi:serine/threonine-protein kinase
MDFVGQTIRTYSVAEQIGGGGQGRVYRAHDTKHGRSVALKVIRTEDIGNAEAVKRFQMEAAISFRLKHPCIVPLYDFWIDKHGVWMAMAFMEGGNLRSRFTQHVLTVAEAGAMLDRIAWALRAAHRISVIHRDVKPDNILFDAQGLAYLSDFGAAKRLKAEKITRTGIVVGSPGYFPPEIIQKGTITPYTDIFSLGVVLYEALTSEHPFDAASGLQMIVNILQNPVPDIRLKRPELPPAIAEVIWKATHKTADARYPDAMALAEAFRTAADLPETPLPMITDTDTGEIMLPSDS